MNKRLADIRERTNRKDEMLAQLSNRLAAVNEERSEKDKQLDRLNTKLSIRMGLKAPSDRLRVQHDRTVPLP